MAEPMYRIIADDLDRRIKAGELEPGAQLPSEIELREEYGQGTAKASRNTVRDAIKLLVTRGLVETRPGQGTFVVKKVLPFVSRLATDPEAGGIEDGVYKDEVGKRGRTPDETRPRVEVQPADPTVAEELGLTGDEQVISRHQERRIDGTPWSMQTTFYPMKFVERGATNLLMAEGTTSTSRESSVSSRSDGVRRSRPRRRKAACRSGPPRPPIRSAGNSSRRKPEPFPNAPGKPRPSPEPAAK